MHQRSHDAAQVHLVSAAVSLAIVLHPQPTQEREKEKKMRHQERSKGKKDEPVETDWERVGVKEHETKAGGSVNSLNRY